MKRLHIFGLLIAMALATLVSPLPAAATPLDFSAIYTADNYVTSFTLQEKGGQAIDLGNKLYDWRQSATSRTVTLKAGKEYTATWQVLNIPQGANDRVYDGVKAFDASTIAGGNPMAFIGVIKVGGDSYYSGANSIFKVGTGTTYQYAPTIWQQNSLQTPGIYETAAWIGSGPNGENTGGAFTVTATFKTAPANTPLPGAIWLLGAGIAGCAGLRKKFKA